MLVLNFRFQNDRFNANGNQLMKIFNLFFLFILLGCTANEDVDSYLFGLKQPLLKPAIFAPGIISTPTANERDVCISKAGDELIFSRNGQILHSILAGGVWSQPVVMSFSGEYPEFEAQLDPTGQRLYYISRRPLSGTGEPENWQTWYTDRDGPGWLEPQRLNEAGDFYPTFTNSGLMYFTDANNDLYRTRVENDTLISRERLPAPVNSDQAEYNAFIAADESYLIFSSHNHSGELGRGDLYISFLDGSGTWTEPRQMGPGINSPALDYCPYVSPDGKYLFFTSRRSGNEEIYWVNAEIIEQLRHKDFDFISGFMTAWESGDPPGVWQYYDDFKREFAAYAEFDGILLDAAKTRFLQQGDTGSALSILKRILEIYPDYQPLLINLEKLVLQSETESLDWVMNNYSIEQDSLPAGLERQLNVLGYWYLQIHLLSQAQTIFAVNCELFPESFNVFDSYAEILLARGDTNAAITNYKKSLELNIENDNARTILTRLVK